MNDSPAPPILSLAAISKRFPSFGLEDISFSLQKGDYFILLGVSGAGKSMVLETIAGLLKPDSGNIVMNGRDITFEKIQKRRIGLVFQDHAVFPHLSVAENIGYPLKGIGINHAEKKSIISDIASTLGISGLLHRRPSTLSGGELQRVALARALVQKPEILLLDEPLASLDTKLKSELRSLLRQLNRKGLTIIHVTHDYEEALSLGSAIAVMHEGKVLQSGSPEEVFANPKSEFVAHFTGAKNFFKATISEAGLARIEDKMEVRISTEVNSTKGYILIGSEDIFLSISPVDTSAVNNFEGRVVEIVSSVKGIEILLDVGVPLYALITAESLNHLGIKEGSKCYAHFKASSVRFIPS